MGEQHSASSQRTFRDPAGSIEIRPDGAFRHVNPAYASDLLAFLALPIAAQLIDSGQLISSEILTPPPSEATADQSESQPLLLRHPRVSFVSYPWEWAPALWLSAAELTLDICSDLLKEGWILKDATPLNVLFQGVEPVFVDVLSIEHADLKQHIWLAYGQFIRTFLLPMLAHARLGWPLQVSLTRRDGFEPEDIYAALSWTQRLRQPALSSVTLPILLSSRKTEAPASELGTKPVSRAMSDPEITRQVLLRTLSGLRSGMRRVTPSQRDSTWSDYVNTATHYTTEDHAEKRAFVSSALAAAQPSRVLDVGCNTGVYSILAADAGAEVVSIDTDLQAVDRLCTTIKGTGKNILPLCVDLARPTPAVGWMNRENASFLDRATGHFDTVMMLAVIHHLLLQSQIPLAHIADLCSNLTTQHLILEWVPPQDSKFQQLVRGRDALYTHLNETAFREAFAAHFTVHREVTLANQRILFHFTKRTA